MTSLSPTGQRVFARMHEASASSEISRRYRRKRVRVVTRDSGTGIVIVCKQLQLGERKLVFYGRFCL